MSGQRYQSSFLQKAGCGLAALPHFSASSVEVHTVLRMATENVCVERPERSTVVVGLPDTQAALASIRNTRRPPRRTRKSPVAHALAGDTGFRRWCPSVVARLLVAPLRNWV